MAQHAEEGQRGDGGRVEGDAGPSFGGCVTRLKKEGSIWDSGIARTVFGPVKEMLNESVDRCEGWKRENQLLCWHWRRASTRKAARKVKGREGGRVVVGDGSLNHGNKGWIELGGRRQARGNVGGGCIVKDIAGESWGLSPDKGSLGASERVKAEGIPCLRDAAEIRSRRSLPSAVVRSRNWVIMGKSLVRG